MQTRNFEDFMTTLPGLVTEANRVVVATYNDIRRHREGGGTLANGKSLRILCGNGSYRHVEVIPGVTIPIPGADKSIRAGASKVVTAMSEPLTHALVILYAGLTQFDSMWSLTQRLVQNGNTVVILGCGCPNNTRDIRDLSETANVIAVTPSIEGLNGCDGGSRHLSYVLDALIGTPAEAAV